MSDPTQTPALLPTTDPLVEDAARECLAALAGVDTYDTNLRDHGEAWAAIEAFADKVRAAERKRSHDLAQLALCYARDADWSRADAVAGLIERPANGV